MHKTSSFRKIEQHFNVRSQDTGEIHVLSQEIIVM